MVLRGRGRIYNYAALHEFFFFFFFLVLISFSDRYAACYILNKKEEYLF